MLKSGVIGYTAKQKNLHKMSLSKSVQVIRKVDANCQESPFRSCRVVVYVMV
jgi:hypothetical protein